MDTAVIAAPTATNVGLIAVAVFAVVLLLLLQVLVLFWFGLVCLFCYCWVFFMYCYGCCLAYICYYTVGGGSVYGREHFVIF